MISNTLRTFSTLFFACLVLVTAIGPAIAGIRTDAPPRVDPFKGIVDRKQLMPGDPQALSHPKELRAAMLLTENTKTHLAWCEEQTAGVGSLDRSMVSFFGGAQAIVESDRMHVLAYGPKFVTDAVTLPLVQRFASVKIIGSIEEFRRGPFDLLILMDVSFVNTFSDSILIIGGTYETGTFINSYFIDPRMQLVGKVEVGEQKEVDRDTFLRSVAQLRQTILERYQSALTTALGPIPVAAPATADVAPRPALPTATPAAPVRSVQERLKMLDDLVKQGLLTNEEAAAKRVEILKAL